ncbi:MAG: DUF1801 domain-containing protein [Bauldia sp.]
MPISVDDYLAGLSGTPAATAIALRDLIRKTAPGLRESIKWGQPVYELGGPVCYFKAHKNHVTFGFWRGQDLTSLSPRLESGGQKMAHIKLADPADIDIAEISALIERAIEINKDDGDPTKPGQPG